MEESEQAWYFIIFVFLINENMNKYFTIYFLVLLFLLSACQPGDKNSFQLTGNIDGFKKGTIYLEKVQDTLIQVVDSFLVKDNGQFKLSYPLESPEIFYLRIKEIPDERLLVFGEPAEMQLNSKLEKFVLAAEVTGSENQRLLEDFKDMMQQFNDAELSLYKVHFDAKKNGDSLAVDSLDAAYRNLLKRSYLYTVNYAVKHHDQEIAPYLALTEMYDANIKLLDTVNNSLTPEVKNSTYGKQLDNFLKVIKENEEKSTSESE